jgi:hypothetical protein
VEYAWKKGFPWVGRADPQAVANRILELSSSGKHPTAWDVLEDGRRIDAPHHNIFEWEDSVAAEQYRLGQAGHILRSIVIVRTDSPEAKKPIRAFVHVIPPEQKDPAYVNIVDAMKNEDMRRQVLEKAMGELEIWRDTYEGYLEFQPVVDAIEEVRPKVKRSKSRTKAAEAEA